MAKWAAIIGTKGIGKSSTSLELARLLRNRHLRVGGFVQQGYLDDLERKCYNLHRLDGSHVVPLARPMTMQQATVPDDQVSVCSLAFDQQAFTLACAWIEQDLRVCPIIIIDEVSKLEAIGRGHHDAIVKALQGPPDSVVVLSIRAGQLYYIVEKYNLQDDAVALLELPASASALEEFAQSLTAT